MRPRKQLQPCLTCWQRTHANRPSLWTRSAAASQHGCSPVAHIHLSAGYNANLVSAGDSDARLMHRLDGSQSAFSALSLDLAISQMPRLQVLALPLL